MLLELMCITQFLDGQVTENGYPKPLFLKISFSFRNSICDL